MHLTERWYPENLIQLGGRGEMRVIPHLNITYRMFVASFFFTQVLERYLTGDLLLLHILVHAKWMYEDKSVGCNTASSSTSFVTFQG